jgi:hypothetical protein
MRQKFPIGTIGHNLLMEESGAGPGLIIVCGLPGWGKTTLAQGLEGRLHALRFSPDEGSLTHETRGMRKGAGRSRRCNGSSGRNFLRLVLLESLKGAQGEEPSEIPCGSELGP